MGSYRVVFVFFPSPHNGYSASESEEMKEIGAQLYPTLLSEKGSIGFELCALYTDR